MHNNNCLGVCFTNITTYHLFVPSLGLQNVKQHIEALAVFNGPEMTPQPISFFPNEEVKLMRQTVLHNLMALGIPTAAQGILMQL